MTVHVGISEAKTRLTELVDQVSSGGDDVLITKRGKPVARLLATEESGIEDGWAPRP